MKTSSRKARFLTQTLGLLFLIPGLAMPAGLVKFSKPDPPQEMRSAGDPTILHELASNGHLDPDQLRLLKIHMIQRGFKTGLSSAMEIRLTKLIYQESLQYNYDPELILALIMNESSFYNWSISRVGALGLMQLLPTTGRALAQAINLPWEGDRTLFNPDMNIKLGTHYLASLHDRFGDLKTALTAYNYGPSRVAEMQRHCDRLPQGYSSRILNAYEQFKGLHLTDLVRSWHPEQLLELINSFQVNSFGI